MYCYDILSLQIIDTLHWGLFSPEVPVLVYYSHLSAILVSVILSFFIVLNNRTLAAKLLVGSSLVFMLLAVIDILLWTQIDSRILMFLWSWWPFLFITVCVLNFYFLVAFTQKRDVSLATKGLWGGVLLGVLALSLSPLSLNMFDVYNCNAIEGINVWTLIYALSFLIFLSSVVYGILQIRRTTNISERRKNLLATVGVSCFLLFFSAAAYIGTLANLLGSDPEIFQIEQYGYFGMALFIAFLTYIIVRYQAFNIKLIAAQALVAALVVLIASQFFFIRNPTNIILNSVTLVLSIGFGFLLVKSVQQEVKQRERVELLAKELNSANKQQVALIHFITHQLKGFVAKSRNIFAMIQEGDYGAVPDPMKPMIDEGFKSATKGAQTIQEILNAANIKSGKVAMVMVPFDFKVLIEGIIANLKPNADAKGVALTVTAPTEPVMLTGDQMQMENAIKNMVDNTIKYTREGSIKVTLTKDDHLIHFMTEDTGVGITPEDMKHLFTEGGHGAESQKVNVDSTGFGLYIVKNIIEAHKGRVWAESEGAGKGSKFIVELPVS